MHGKSAYHGKHQQYLNEALADMRAGLIKVLVIWHSDRLERRPGEALLDVLEEFTVAGGRVESVQEPTLGQLDFGGQVTTFIAGLVNHEKSAHIAAQVGIAFDAIRANGALDGRPPFGFTTAGAKYCKTLVPTDDGMTYVPEIFKQVIDGQPLRDIAAWLDANGVTPQSGGRWWAKTVSALVRNPTYRGSRCELTLRPRPT